MPSFPLVETAPSNVSVLSTFSMADSVPPMSDESLCNISVFDETSCGEPMRAQRLLIDFTPNKEDSDFVQRKICTFWNFIANTPEIKNLRVLPEKETSYDKSGKVGEGSHSLSLSVPRQPSAMSALGSSGDLVGTAVSQLELVEQKGLINRIFEAKIERSGCTLLGSREYIEMNAPSSMQKKKKQACLCTTTCDTCRGVTPPATPEAQTVKKLCKQMKEWDAKHPKSMAPPSHPPSLIHSALQRPVYPRD
ncbi:uncharacterized protein LOC113492227 [Trichoplusia ni]|uniref:Uncharacterized protein LOC113492227 n=1 Tax=Trichoplusia ni TaxID=7111 RepID=A0A7E5VAU4_TRINI|nr:uncharacterized protein LOC113492227 [Trichoplusia ni]